MQGIKKHVLHVAAGMAAALFLVLQWGPVAAAASVAEVAGETLMEEGAAPNRQTGTPEGETMLVEQPEGIDLPLETEGTAGDEATPPPEESGAGQSGGDGTQEGETPGDGMEADESTLAFGAAGISGVADGLEGITPFTVLPAPAAISSLFPDPLLANAVAAATGLGVDDTVTQGQLDGISQISLSGSAFHNPEGLQYLNGLNTLRIDNAQLTEPFPQDFIDQHGSIQNYYANNQNYTNPLITIYDDSIADIIDLIPGIVLQIMEDASQNGSQVGTWDILNQFNGSIASFPAVNGEELRDIQLPGSGHYTVRLTISSSWMGLEGSIYTFPVEFANSLAGIVWYDQNKNGLLDDGEPRLSGRTVELLANSAVVQTTATGGDGGYTLANTYNDVSIRIGGLAAGESYTYQNVAAGTATQRSYADASGLISGAALQDDTLTGHLNAGIIRETTLYADAVTVAVGDNSKRINPVITNPLWDTQAADGVAYGQAANTAIATVNAATGAITPVSPGVTTSVITISDGPYRPSIQYTVTITVVPAEGILRGMVTDPYGNPLAGVTITLQTGQTVTTNAAGQYIINPLEAGGYTVTARLAGYDAQSKPATIQLNQTTVVNFTLYPSTGSLVGFVGDALSGNPIPGALVTLNTGATAVTDANGYYSFPSLPVGSYNVYVTATGYNSLMRPAPIFAGGQTELDFLLTPVFGRVYGIITDRQTGLPLAGATVTLSNGYTLTTGADGSYSVFVEPGDIEVAATAPNYSAAQGGGLVVSGGELEVNLSLVPNPGTLYGTVTGEAGLPLAGVRITLNDGRSVTTGADGTYRISVEPGSYTLTAAGDGYNSQTKASGPLTAGGSVRVDFTLTAMMGVLQGYVYELGTDPPQPVVGETVTVTLSNGLSTVARDTGFYYFNVPPGAYLVTAGAANYSSDAAAVQVYNARTTNQNLYLSPLPATLTVVVQYTDGSPAEGAGIFVSGGQTAVTDATGIQSFAVAEGSYTVEVQKTGYTVAPQATTLGPNGAETLVFVLEPLYGELFGAVLEGEGRLPMEGVLIEVLDAGGNTVATTTTGPGGTYLVSGLLAGEYNVRATLDGYIPTERPAEIVDGETTRVNFLLNHQRGSIAGHVYYVDGEPVAGVEILVSGGYVVTTSIDGSYYLDLMIGDYMVTETASGHAPQSKEGVVEPGETTVLDFVLDRGSITGVVTDAATGAPLPGAEVVLYDNAGNPLATTTTDANGRYGFGPLPEGSYWVSASLAGYATSEPQPAEVGPEGETTVDLALTATTTPPGGGGGGETGAGNTNPGTGDAGGLGAYTVLAVLMGLAALRLLHLRRRCRP